MTDKLTEMINAVIKTAESLLKFNLDAESITASDYALIRKFLAYKIKIDKISPKRCEIIAGVLCSVRRYGMISEYCDVTTDDVLALFMALTADGSPYKPNTARSNFIIFRMFAAYLTEFEGFKLDMKQIMAIAKPDEFTDGIKPSDVLSEAQFDTLIKACTNARDKAIMAVFADCGVRPEEIGLLKWSDLEFTAESVRIRVTDSKKKSKWKMNYCIDRRAYLIAWQQANELDADKPEMPVFRAFKYPRSLVLSDRAISSEAVVIVATNALKTANISYPVGYVGRLLRTSNITNQIKSGMDLAAIMKSHWSAGLNSAMFRYYEKLADVSTEHMFLKSSGHKVTDLRKKDDREAFICECGHVNAPGRETCLKCGSKLIKADSAAVKENEELKARLADMEAKYNRIIEMLSNK